jgi:hypothetical protein
MQCAESLFSELPAIALRIPFNYRLPVNIFHLMSLPYRSVFLMSSVDKHRAWSDRVSFSEPVGRVHQHQSRRRSSPFRLDLAFVSKAGRPFGLVPAAVSGDVPLRSYVFAVQGDPVSVGWFLWGAIGVWAIFENAIADAWLGTSDRSTLRHWNL